MLSLFPIKTFPPVFDPTPFPKPTLYTYGPGWRNQLLSFDPDCLKWQAYLTFCRVDFGLYNCNEPLASPSGKLPFLAMPTGETLYDEQITFWLRKNETEKKLAEDSEDAEATAFISLAETKLRTALLFSFFLEPRNMSEATGPKYFGHYAKPIDAIIQHRKKNAIIQRMLAKRALLVADEVSIRDRALGLILATRKPKAFSNMHRIIRHIHVYRLTVSRADIYFPIKVYQDAADALLSFSTKLGDEQYFFGSR
ncbi:hypothetical protein BC938DRAFT_482366 [Jimgerdemannia flammicorona]|uniref:Mitochondrial outer membrane transport complex Sam37/metaxin N-terminal domain-containing protein n=1 Tax=Jimgerdemannia flammicorona TaxID=994334 RepID=A0A433QWK0_9FUNG|nr:hypothetical protein BC938DRAFT_482366 [Jimgerdemannia flammicorona]